MNKIEKQVFFKVLLPNNIKCLVKTVGENVKASELKQEVLFDVGFSEESCDDFYLLNITSGQPVTESQCFTCNHRDVIILSKTVDKHHDTNHASINCTSLNSQACIIIFQQEFIFSQKNKSRELDF